MISRKQIEALTARSGVEWITGLKSGALRKLVDAGAIQMDLFAESNRFALSDDAFPGERLVACCNPQLAALRAEKRMSKAWRSLLFADEDQQRLSERDPVAPATRSDAGLEKVASKRLSGGSAAHSFRTLLNELATVVRNTCPRRNADATEQTVEIDTSPNARQRQALELINAIPL